MKINLVICLFAILLLSSCIKTEQENEVKLIVNCTENICSASLAQTTELVTTSEFGKVSSKTIKSDNLRDGTNLNWAFGGAGKFATASQISDADLIDCEGGLDCTPEGNPTGFVFEDSTGVHSVTVRGSFTLPDGSIQTIDESQPIDIHPSDVRTQLTVQIRNGTQFESGSDGTSGISWDVDGSEITFTCPSGYAIPDAAPQELDYGTRSTGDNPDEVDLGRYVNLVVTGGGANGRNDYPAGTWTGYNFSFFAPRDQPSNNGRIEITCIPQAGADNYTFS